MKWTFVALLITGLVLFGERYGINQIKFNNLIPHCGQILPASSCKQYGPWGRDFKLMQKPPSTWSDGRYFLQWAGQNMYEFFFTINYNYFNKAPLPLPFAAAWIATIAGTVAAAWQWKRLRANVAFVFFGFIVAVFSISLWINNLHRFRTVGFPVAIHGRYWVQLLPIIFVLMAVGIKYTVNDLPKRYIQPVSLTVLFGTLVLFSQGGGISSYILKSDASWYWPNTPMIEANDHTRSVLQKVIIN